MDKRYKDAVHSYLITQETTATLQHCHPGDFAPLINADINPGGREVINSDVVERYLLSLPGAVSMNQQCAGALDLSNTFFAK